MRLVVLAAVTVEEVSQCGLVVKVGIKLNLYIHEPVKVELGTNLGRLVVLNIEV